MYKFTIEYNKKKYSGLDKSPRRAYELAYDTFYNLVLKEMRVNDKPPIRSYMRYQGKCTGKLIGNY